MYLLKTKLYPCHLPGFSIFKEVFFFSSTHSPGQNKGIQTPSLHCGKNLSNVSYTELSLCKFRSSTSVHLILFSSSCPIPQTLQPVFSLTPIHLLIRCSSSWDLSFPLDFLYTIAPISGSLSFPSLPCCLLLWSPFCSPSPLLLTFSVSILPSISCSFILLNSTMI